MGDIIRQKTPELKTVVELAAKGQATAYLDVLDQKLHAVHTIDGNSVRYDAIAKRYATLNADREARNAHRYRNQRLA